MSSQAWINLAYLAASMLFIVAFKLMTGPRTAVRGNFLGAVGMAIALAAACCEKPVVDRLTAAGPSGLILVAVAATIGAVIGATMALKYPMTGMPQMVALLNGFGGAASALVAGAELWNMVMRAGQTGSDRAAAAAWATLQLAPWTQFAIATALTGLIGAVTFWGSLVAFAKLEELPRFKKAWTDPNRHLINLGLALITLGLIWGVCVYPKSIVLYWLLVVAGSALGCTLTMPIGGADMPVVISLYNALTGLAVAFEGYVLQNEALMIAGMVVGAAGMLLTQLMAKAMNRSLGSVLFGSFGATGEAQAISGSQKPIEASDVAAMMAYAERVVIVPGYGMAVAQAQHKVWELTQALQKRGVQVKFAIHPVAGRMPGHMNVLLAEAGVPYDIIADMDDINPEFPITDVALVIGANDVVNPVAKTDPASPIYGMPILDVSLARNVIVVKRGKGTGFAGIENALFYADNARMLYGDASGAIAKLIGGMKELDGGGH